MVSGGDDVVFVYTRVYDDRSVEGHCMHDAVLFMLWCYGVNENKERERGMGYIGGIIA